VALEADLGYFWIKAPENRGNYRSFKKIKQKTLRQRQGNETFIFV
jgi:hypothetical protein